MSTIDKRIGDVQSMSPKGKPIKVMSPSVSKDLQRQYSFRRTTTDFTERSLKYGQNVYMARVQGINEDDFYRWYKARIRIAQMVRHGTTTNIIEDWKEIKFESSKVNMIGLGAKIECNGNTYIVSNPDESNGTQATAVCRRCNVTWRRLDFYGRIKEEPFYWAKNQSQASANEYLDYMVTPNLYQKCVMQLNEDTVDLKANRRMILGSGAYMVRGLVDFLQSETGDHKSTHILYFDLQSQEPIDKDDLENRVADGKSFDMHATLGGVPAKTIPGSTFQAEIETVRNGQILQIVDGVTYGATADGSEPERLGEYPLTWQYYSTDTSVATVDSNGLVTAVAEGECQIKAVLLQNNDITCETDLTVSTESEEKLEWVQSTESAVQYHTVALECRYALNGVLTDEQISYTVATETGDRNAADYEINGNVITITGYMPDVITVTAEANGLTSTKRITISGY